MLGVPTRLVDRGWKEGGSDGGAIDGREPRWADIERDVFPRIQHRQMALTTLPSTGKGEGAGRTDRD